MNKAVRSLAAAAVSVLALAGCAQSPNTAATVDGVTITEATVQQASEAVMATYGVTPAEARTFAVNRVIQGVLAERMARDNGITITEADRAKFVAGQPELAALASHPGGQAFADGWIGASVVARSLGSDALLTEIAKHQVVPNPRYGTWDPAIGALAGTGSLSAEATRA